MLQMQQFYWEFFLTTKYAAEKQENNKNKKYFGQNKHL